MTLDGAVFVRSSAGPEYGTASDRIFVGMATAELGSEDVCLLVNTVAALGREIEENGKVTQRTQS